MKKAIDGKVLKTIGTRTALAVVLATALSGAAFADEAWPAHSVRILIPAGPGGAVDTVARLLATKLTASFGQSVVPENRPGAGTMIASDMVAKAKPDGYVVVVITGSHAVNAAVRRSLPYDPVKDFVPVTQVATLPDMLVVNPALPVKSVKDLIADAKAHPGQLTFGSAGAGSETQMEGELFKLRAGIDMLHVPYKTGVDAVTGTVGGQVQVLFFNAIGVAGQVRAGRLRALAVTGAHRADMFPDLPTMMEAGVPDYDTGSWYGVLLPAGTPAAIVTRYNQDIVKALKTPEVEKALHNAGAEIVGSSPEDFKNFLIQDIGLWQGLVKQRPELRGKE